MPLPRLPGEIVDAIIAAVWPDAQTLLTCALVCSDWLPASRHQLFHRLVISDPTGYDKLVTRVLHEPTLQPCLQSVRIVEIFELRPIDEYRYSPTPADEQLGRFFFHHFAGYLPNVVSLTMHCVDWAKCPPHPTAPAMLLLYPAIRELRLYDCSFPSFGTLRRMIASLPGLTDLNFLSVRFPHRSWAIPKVAYPQTRPKLQKLTFGGTQEGDEVCVRGCLQWLSVTPSASSIFFLHLTGAPPSILHAMEMMAGMTHIFAASVRSLFLDVMLDGFDLLSDFAHLDSLTININHERHGAVNWRAVSSMLDAIAARLRILDVQFFQTYRRRRDESLSSCAKRHEFAYGDQLEALDPILEQKRFECLELVAFSIEFLILPNFPEELEPTLTWEELVETVEKRLPKLSARKIIRVNCSKRRSTMPDLDSE